METAEVTRKLYSDRKHEESVVGSAKNRTTARVTTQAAPVKVTAPFKKSTKKHKTNGGSGA